jgi:predicted transcriptional regulator
MAETLSRTQSAISSRILTLIRAGTMTVIVAPRASQRGAAARTWNPAKIAALVALRRQGTKVPEIALKLDSTSTAVYAQLKRLYRVGRLPRLKRPAYSTAESTLLQDKSVSATELATRLGRSIASIRTKRIRLGVTGRAFWTFAEDDYLVRHRQDGDGLGAIARAIGRSESAVTNRVTALVRSGRVAALTPSERGRRGAAAAAACRQDKWNEQERIALVRHWTRGQTAEETASALGRTRSAVSNELAKLRRLGKISRLSSLDAQARAKRIQRLRRAERYDAAVKMVQALPNTKAAGYVLGVLYGDGFITIQGDRGSIGLKSTNESFCLAFADALRATFGREVKLLSRIEPYKEIRGHVYTNVRYYEAFLHSVHLGRAIRHVFGMTDEMRWRANPGYAMSIGSDFADGLIQGFFDAEGSFMRDQKGKWYTSACSMNELGLQSIAALLTLRGYPATVGCDARKQWRVALHKQSYVRRFATEISSRIDYKLARMQECVNSSVAAE